MMIKNNLVLYTLILVVTALLTSCGGGSRHSGKQLEQAEGDVFYGKVFTYNESEYFRSLYPLNVTEVVGHRITNQIYEGLVRLSQEDLSIQPALAKRWEIDSSATTFTFHLREGVHFHDDPCFKNGKGPEVTAHDFEYSLTKLCEADVNNQGFWVFEDRVKGATAYHESTKEGEPLEEGVTGTKVLDDTTLQIELVKPFASFLNILAMPFTAVFPREAVEEYGKELRKKAVGTGPFEIEALREDEAVVLTKNEDYWGKDQYGNPLPYLDGIRVSFIKDKKSSLLKFRKNELDMMYRIPLEMTNQVITEDDELKGKYKQYDLQVMPSLTIQYYGFQHKSDLFANKHLRKAFNYAIDRTEIVDYTLKGTAVPAHNGVVPPALENYDSKAINGYKYNAAKAREHMKQAGYPNGDGFPEITLQINSGGGRNEQVAEAIQKMLQENLNISMNIKKLSFAQHLENLESGKARFWRAGWIADYPDPENFLNLFYGPHVPDNLNTRSYINSVRYQSAEFDSVFQKALQTVDKQQRNLLYLQADQIVMDDAAIMPIYYDKDYRLLQPDVRNFPQNPMEYRNFRDVYFVPNSDQMNM